MAAGAGGALLRAAEGALNLQGSGTHLLVQIRSDAGADWQVEHSSDLVSWTAVTNFASLLSGGPDAAWRALGAPDSARRFYRARQTDGLFDPAVLRSLDLTFTQPNWSNLLVSARAAGTNVECALLTLDNGLAVEGAGARYRGNTSFTGFGGTGAPPKKSLNIEVDHTVAGARLMRFSTINLNNAFQDSTLLREVLYFNAMRPYTVCPAASLVRVNINGTYHGVYSLVQQQNKELIREYFPGSGGDRWRAPNMGGGGGGPGGGGAGGGGNSALLYLGNTNIATYQRYYELKAGDPAVAWPRLIHAIRVLNTTPSNQLRDQVEEVLAVDRWLWFLALENLFVDDDSYWNKGADYRMYYEPESGRLHPVEHDGNESFLAREVTLSPVQGATAANRPVISRLLAIPELRQRYLAHFRTALEESFHPAVLATAIDHLAALSGWAIAADPLKGYPSMVTYTNGLNALKTFVTNRYNYLTNHPELRPIPPEILSVEPPDLAAPGGYPSFITARVRAGDAAGLDSVWLYHRAKPYGRFACEPMFDDGLHGDGEAGDGIFGIVAPAHPSASTVQFYVEARSANAARTARFSPARAEQETWSYRVPLLPAPTTPVVINEFMADNKRTLADPQGQFDDWIELLNLTDTDVDLSGHYLSDNPGNPRKWPFPDGTILPAHSFLIVWADDDTGATPGLHANFKLSKDGEHLLLVAPDAQLNAILDHVVFGPQETDRSYGRSAPDPNVWVIMTPSPGQPNR